MIMCNNDITIEELEHKKKRITILDEDLDMASEYAIQEAARWDDAISLLKDKKHFGSQICVISLFSLELYIKAILMKKGTNITEKNFKHKIYDMYLILDKEEKDKIKKNVSVDKKQCLSLLGDYITFKNFEEELKYISNDFVYLRYEYEKFMNGFAILPLTDFIIKITDNAGQLAREIVYNKK